VNGASEVSAAHAELDRQVTLLLLAIDVGGARDQLYSGDLPQRDLGDAAGPLDADADVADRLCILPELWSQSHHDREYRPRPRGALRAFARRHKREFNGVSRALIQLARNHRQPHPIDERSRLAMVQDQMLDRFEVMSAMDQHQTSEVV
jgi:hypothetical protein